jgi:hypothetical protein
MRLLTWHDLVELICSRKKSSITQPTQWSGTDARILLCRWNLGRTRVTRDLSRGRGWCRRGEKHAFLPRTEKVRDRTTSHVVIIAAMNLLVRSFPEFWVKFPRSRKVIARPRRANNVLPQSRLEGESRRCALCFVIRAHRERIVHSSQFIVALLTDDGFHFGSNASRSMWRLLAYIPHFFPHSSV